MSVAILLVVMVAIVAGVAVAADWDGFPLGLLVGIVAGVVVSAACWFIVEGSGARSYAIGSVAESWTADAFAKLSPEWRRVHSVPIGDQFDIDHVLIGPPGVFAVETKFTASPWDFNADKLGAYERRALRNAERGALKIRNVLNATGRPTVTPVLVVWGPGSLELPAFEIVGRVLVCAGGQSTLWLSYLKTLEPVLADERRDRMVHAIEGHVTRTEAAFGRDDHRGVRSQTKSVG